ncbi:MAG: ABC transporter ATP-binding protein [Alphaproteobacteria bacterium]|nr:ABC transporter ATP-binding protein [Alphaproteobacteria bacterium]
MTDSRGATENRARAPLLEFRQARISFMLRAGEANVIPGLSFSLGAGEALGLVGESGCGKSTVALATMRYLGRAGRVTSGSILFEGQDIARMSEDELRRIRGRRIAMVYQDPMSSLNPVKTIGKQLMEVPMIHEGADAAAARALAVRMLEEVKLPDAAGFMDRYPHQLSGGQQQRVVIAMALIARPSLLIMDEPTTGLDVTVEAAVLDLVRELRQRHNSAILFISHNLGTVVRVCDRIGVMYAGEMVEQGTIRQVFANPRHPYTRGLLDCLPTLGRDKHGSPLATIPGQVGSPLSRPPGCSFARRCGSAEEGRCTTAPIPIRPVPGEAGHEAQCVRMAELEAWLRKDGQAGAVPDGAETAPLVEIAGLRKTYRQTHGLFGDTGKTVKALNDVDMFAEAGRTLAIVGESGCGKSTLAKIMSGLVTASEGTARIGPDQIAATAIDQRPQALKRKLQMVFQNPDSTLNPSHSVGYVIGRALRRLKGLGKRSAEDETRRLLDVVKLSGDFAGRKPHQLSGGQKQRVAIARALAGDPEVIIADEPVSALDVSVQAAIINLLNELQGERATTLLFISHDLAVVRYMADHVAVMYLGKVVEFGRAAEVFEPPFHPYTEALLSAAPVPDPDRQGERIILDGALPSATDLPPGCPFASRCPRKVGSICDTTPPPAQRLAHGHRIACHIEADELVSLQQGGAPERQREKHVRPHRAEEHIR